MKKDIKNNQLDDQLISASSVNKSAVNKSRRHAVTAAGVAAASAAWHKPIINSVMLPAHAQTSDAMSSSDLSDGDTFVLNPGVTSNGNTENSNLLDLLVSEAHAGGNTPGRGSLMKLTYDAPSDSFDYEQANRNRSIKRIASGLEEGVGQDATTDVECGGGDNQASIPIHTITIQDITPAGVVLRIDARIDPDSDGGVDNRGSNTFLLEPGDYDVEACEDE